MHRKNGSLGAMAGTQTKKRKPKPKVSELDEIAAKRRRAQASRAQRAFRQRKEDTIASLNEQIASLNRTVEDLNTCFLTLTDDLVASGWLEHDPQVTKAVQRTIERFIAAVRASNAPQKDDQSASDCDPVTPKISRSSPHATGILEHEEMVVPSVGSTAPWEAAIQPSGFGNFSGELVSHHINSNSDAFNILSWPLVTGLLNPPRPTFAQRLHLEAIQAGLRLVRTAEDRTLEFYRVFNRKFDLHTREGLRALLNRILDHNSNQLPQPPPESNVDMSGSGGMSRAWLNASDVARHFRTIGIDLDGSHGIVTARMHSSLLPVRLLNSQWPAGTGLITPGDGLKESTHEQPLHNLGYFSGTEHHYSTAAGQDVNSFGMFANNFASITPSHDMLPVAIDVSKLIHEIVLGTRCFDRHPSFNIYDLDDALARAVIETQELKGLR